METVLFVLAVVLGLIESASLFAKTEGFRGAGRVLGGLATILTGCVLLSISGASFGTPAIFTTLSVLVIVRGLIAFGSGARKFMRRKLPQQ